MAKTLTEGSSLGEVKRFLINNQMKATNEKSKVNPSFTKRQMWHFWRDHVDSTTIKTKFMLIDQVTKEFGKEY